MAGTNNTFSPRGVDFFLLASVSVLVLESIMSYKADDTYEDASMRWGTSPGQKIVSLYLSDVASDGVLAEM